MTASTATLVHTSSREVATRDALARVAAAGRITDARKADAARREAREAAVLAHNLIPATAWVDGVVAAGATLVGFKVCLAEGGKYRPTMSAEFAADFIARHVADGDEVEAWGLTDMGEYVGEVLSVW